MRELTDDERRVLAAIAELEEQHDAPSSTAVANTVGATLSPVRDIINRLHEAGLVSASLKVSDEGRKALG